MTNDRDGWLREGLRQQLLLQTLWQRAPDAGLGSWLRDDPSAAARGMAAYRGNGRALAERALRAAFPTLAELIGGSSLAALARAFWHRHPATDGDIALYGAAMAAFIDNDEQLAAEPYLADVARLDWAVHQAEAARDAEAVDAGLQHLADDHALTCRLRLRPGTAVLASDWPVVAIWQAHRRAGADRFAPVRAALAQGRGECALVYRDGWQVRVDTLEGAAAAHFTRAVLAEQTLGNALAGAGTDFNFEPWLVRALQQQWLLAVLAPDSRDDGDAA